MHPISLRIAWLSALTAQSAADDDLLPLLEGVRNAGSLRLAARTAGVSYRHAWGLLGRCARAFGHPLVVLERGRGAHLAPLGEKLLWANERIETELGRHLTRLGEELQREIAGAAATRPLRIFASHDLVLAKLRDFAAHAQPPLMEIQFRGSLDNLAALRRAECDLAGFHVPEDPGAPAREPGLRRWLDPAAHVLVNFVARRQGLIVQRGNPKRIRSLKDLTRRAVRFVNRQNGSGTRLALDRLLRRNGIAPGDISGYQTEEFTHLAVAATVAGKMADAGFGIEAAAAQYRLDFIPISSERYFLACRRDLTGSAQYRRLEAMLGSRSFRRTIADLPGYDLGACGTFREVSELLDGTASGQAAPIRKKHPARLRP